MCGLRDIMAGSQTARRTIMKVLKRQMVQLGLALSLASPILAQQKSIKLPVDSPMSQLNQGPGREIIHRNCLVCHSTDYIVRQPRLDAMHWEAEVTKMITVFGARIDDSDAKLIAEYLAKNYGFDEKSIKENQDSNKR